MMTSAVLPRPVRLLLAAAVLGVVAPLGMGALRPVAAQEPAFVDPNGPPVLGTAGNPWTFVMQQWLKDNGFRPGAVDGWFGKNTRAAVVRFQQTAGIDPNGAWTWQTSQAQMAYQPPASTSNPGVAYGVWDRLAMCESNGNWSISTGNGYFGGLQFSLTSWRATGGTGYPHHHSREEQIRRAEILLDMQGWMAWPTCSRVIGVR